MWSVGNMHLLNVLWMNDVIGEASQLSLSLMFQDESEKLSQVGSLGNSASVSLLDWHDLDQGIILVAERPVVSLSLYKYRLEEKEAEVSHRTILLNTCLQAKVFRPNF